MILNILEECVDGFEVIRGCGRNNANSLFMTADDGPGLSAH